MATHTNLSSLFTDIADSIRSVSGSTASIQADTFPTAIQSLGSGFAKIQTGSYVGTGTYGLSNPCSLTFDFVSKLIVVQQIDNCWFLCHFVFNCNEASSSFSQSSSYGLNCSWTSKMISWYNVSSNSNQLNATGRTYNYVSIG